MTDEAQDQPVAPEVQSLEQAPPEVERQNGTPLSPLPPAESAGPAQAGEQASASPRAETDETDETDGEQGGADQAEVARNKKRLDGVQEDRARRESQIKRQEKQRLIEFGKSGISLQLLEDQDARREDKLFVPPGDYQRFVDEIVADTGKHILIVAGRESSGKLMTAFYLARHLWWDRALQYYRFCAQGNRSLLDIWADEHLPDNAVILFDEVFNKEQLDPDDLTNRYVHLTERLAERTNVWFIFTVREGPVLERLRASGYLPILSTGRVDRPQVLEKLIDYHFPRETLTEEVRTRFLSGREKLPEPARLGQLFEGGASDLQAVLQGLEQQEQVQQEAPAAWFAGLKPLNYQLYALLAVLFDRLDMPTLEEIYTAAVHALRRQGMDGPDEFIDPRRIGTNLMHSSLGIQVRYGVLEFRNRFYRQYIEAQVENYQRLLWSLIDPDDPSTFEGLVGLLRRLSELDEQRAVRGQRDGQAASYDRSRQLRYAIAVMIARVGIYHQTKLDLLLEKLVHDESPVVSLTAAQVLAEIARRGTHFDVIERILRTWMFSGRIDQMWVAAPSIAYIYIAIAGSMQEERALQEAEEQAELDGDEDREAEMGEEEQKRGKGYLAKLRDLLTELVKVHRLFSQQACETSSQAILGSLLASLKRHYEESSEPLTEEHGRLFRELTEVEKQRFLLAIYMGSKREFDEEVAQELDLLTNSWLNQMRMVLMQTLEQIMHLWPRDVTRLVRMWLDRKNKEDPLWEIGHMGLNYLFQESLAIKDPSLLEQAAYPLLDLIPLAMRAHTLTLGSLRQHMNLFLHIERMEENMTLEQHLEVRDLLGGDSLLYVLSALQRWYENLGQAPIRWEPDVANEDEENEQSEGDGEQKEDDRRQHWRERVSAVLANAMNNAPQQERQRLRSALALWVKTGDRELHRIARILISHAYVMDGIVLDLPSSRRTGLVVIDSQRREPEDRERMSYLLQNLSAIVPIHLRWLGYTRISRSLHSDSPDEQGQREEQPALFGPNDLLLKSTRRPALLMPILQPGQGQAYTSEQTHFVVVFHTEKLLDVAELYPGLAATESQGPSNPFLQHIQRQQAAARVSSQPWQGKVYLQSNEPQPELPAGLELLLTAVRPASLATLEEELRTRVAMTLRIQPAPELWQELRVSSGISISRAPTVAELSEQIARWLSQLADTSQLSPDVSLFILWTVMVRSLEDLSEARQLVEFLWQEPEESGTQQRSRQEEKEARRARRLRQQMGIACTRMLFHLYGARNPTLPLEPYGELLLLLPRMMVSATSASELLPVLAILYELVRNERWLQVVNDDEGAFFECIGKVALKELDLLRGWVKNYQYLVALSRVFLEVKQPFRDFVDFGEQVARRSRTSRSGRPARNVATVGEMAGKFLTVLPAENDVEEQQRYTWALEQLEFQQASFCQPAAGEEIRAGLRKQEILLNHLADEIQARQDGTIERLAAGNVYGVVLVEAGNKAAVHQAFGLVQEFVTHRRQHRGQGVTLLLQRLGEKEPLAKIRTAHKIKKEREISDPRPRPLLMGPLLARYPADQVAFVLLITVLPVLDYDDWVEQESWAGRLWLASLGNWQPYRGETVTLGESTSLALETILQTVEGEKAIR